MYSSPSGLAPAISPASPSPKLHSHSFSWGPSLSLESIANWHFLTLERNKYNSPDWYILCCPLGSAFKLSSWPLNRCQQVSPSDSRSGLVDLPMKPPCIKLIFIFCEWSMTHFLLMKRKFFRIFLHRSDHWCQLKSGTPPIWNLSPAVQLCCADICLRVPTSKDQPQMWRHFSPRRACRKCFPCNCQWSSTCLQRIILHPVTSRVELHMLKLIKCNVNLVATPVY